jgi:hypothetical protein
MKKHIAHGELIHWILPRPRGQHKFKVWIAPINGAGLPA